MYQLSRLKLLTNETTIEKIMNTNVLLIGLGGVGGFAFDCLIRSGICDITIVDGDKFEITNLNRQLFALHTTIGENKTDVCEKFGKQINPEVNIKKISKNITLENINEIDFKQYDYILDACDTVSIKKEIIRICTRNNIKLISCMGTGNKLKPNLLEITEIRKTKADPLAKILRKMVKEERIKQKVHVVSSTEVPKKVEGREIGSITFVPATAGILMASYVINDIIGD